MLYHFGAVTEKRDAEASEGSPDAANAIEKAEHDQFVAMIPSISVDLHLTHPISIEALRSSTLLHAQSQTPIRLSDLENDINRS